MDLGQNFGKISILVKIFENLDFGQISWNSRFIQTILILAKIVKMSNFVKNCRKLSQFSSKFSNILILVKIYKILDFGKIFENLDFGQNFRKILISVKIF